MFLFFWTTLPLNEIYNCTAFSTIEIPIENKQKQSNPPLPEDCSIQSTLYDYTSY